MALIGLKYPIVAPVKAYTPGAYPTIAKGDAFVLGKLIAADREIKFSSNPLYGDNEKAEDITIFEEGTLKLNVDDITLEAQSKMFGHTYTKANLEGQQAEEIVKGGNDVPPYMAVGYYKTLFKNNKRLYEGTIIYKTKFSPPKESAKTKEKSITWGTYESEGVIETLSGFENEQEPYEKVARFDTEAAAQAWLKKFFAMDGEE